ncbi:uncharacterized membrane protein YhaH (DUF805 family) [Sphingobium fontiphilum]|uniref:Uncharacterized membrane protein YhaH (DUF805 family) n=2 Tax=Sphingobium fontiphilum TaxID=944425 RepID=A0A7W6DP79_9SPHN|nr:DUF805 domain-containing protein [Sphingobium fontiphilum]MBB3982574.1 uncharacterized membrane protein YhaH (DUF805 family) [Sphingobium fontiphilum]
MDWVRLFLKRWSDTSGRSERREYIAAVGSMIAAILVGMVPFIGVFAIVALIVFIIPLWTVTIRRWHDLNLPGFLVLVGVLIPGVNVIAAIFLCILPGTRGDNNYGAEPGLPSDYLGKI